MRCPDHGRPYDWPYREDDPPPEPLPLTVYPTDDDEPEPALYGADGEPLLWREHRRPIGYRRLDDELEGGNETP